MVCGAIWWAAPHLAPTSGIRMRGSSNGRETALTKNKPNPMMNVGMDNDNGRTLSDLDEIDLRIVQLLQENGRRSNSDIARQIGVSEPTVRKRIERLVQDRIIKVVAVFNPRRTGYTSSAL